MIYYHLLILGLVQGITEFLPISSSAHLILLPKLAGWQDQGLVYDIAAHLGTLTAVTFYFRQDLQRMTRAWLLSLKGGQPTQESRLAWYVILATVPVVVAGVLMYDTVSTTFRNPLIIAGTTIGFGLVLWWADRYAKEHRQLDSLTLKNALWIGLSQVIALVPGTSRSGITMTTGLVLGFSRQAAARFSFYLSIPTILLAACHTVYRYSEEAIAFNPSAFVMVMVLSAFSAGLTIHFFLGFIERTGMLPYVIYRILLGILLLVIFLP
ncbi:MAG TPA: undecaprenyl-diphosphate phosphatase [Gammaproteobacteria bacterium]|nr:undecaprenyl-diphosphate phosphatase [Gammaproteobacteria bacterium]